jgi:hypothetical protein
MPNVVTIVQAGRARSAGDRWHVEIGVLSGVTMWTQIVNNSMIANVFEPARSRLLDVQT